MLDELMYRTNSDTHGNLTSGAGAGQNSTLDLPSRLFMQSQIANRNSTPYSGIKPIKSED